MKVAITSKGNALNSQIDGRFGRCAFFAIYNTENQEVEFIANQNRDLVEGVGPASFQLIASKGIKKVISGEFGVKVRGLFDQLKIQQIIISDSTKTITDIIDSLNYKN